MLDFRSPQPGADVFIHAGIENFEGLVVYSEVGRKRRSRRHANASPNPTSGQRQPRGKSALCALHNQVARNCQPKAIC
jgi:hypothetical protein